MGGSINFYLYVIHITFYVVLISATFGLIFTDQSFWQCGVAAKPSHSVWGFITGGLVWFALAFVSSFAIGMAYLAFSVKQGFHMVTDQQAVDGEWEFFTLQ